MKTLKTLIILCIIISLDLQSVKAQVPQKTGYEAISGITFSPIGNLDTTFGSENITGLYRPTCWVPYWIEITEKTSFDPLTINGNCYYLKYKPILLNCKTIRSEGKSTYMAGYGNSGTFNGKWERLTGKPIFDTTSVYYYPLKRTNAPTWTDNHLYRLTGNIFNIIMDTRYPARNASK